MDSSRRDRLFLRSPAALAAAGLAGSLAGGCTPAASPVAVAAPAPEVAAPMPIAAPDFAFVVHDAVLLDELPANASVSDAVLASPSWSQLGDWQRPVVLLADVTDGIRPDAVEELVIYGAGGALCRRTVQDVAALGVINLDRYTLEAWGLRPRYSSEEAALAGEADEIEETGEDEMVAALWKAAQPRLALGLAGRDPACQAGALWAAPASAAPPRFLRLEQAAAALATATREAFAALPDAPRFAGYGDSPYAYVSVDVASGDDGAAWVLARASRVGCEGFDDGLFAAAPVRDGVIAGQLVALKEVPTSDGDILSAFVQPDGSLAVIARERESGGLALLTWRVLDDGALEARVVARLEVPYVGMLQMWDYGCG